MINHESRRYGQRHTFNTVVRDNWIICPASLSFVPNLVSETTKLNEEVSNDIHIIATPISCDKRDPELAASDNLFPGSFGAAVVKFKSCTLTV